MIVLALLASVARSVVEGTTHGVFLIIAPVPPAAVPAGPEALL